MSSLFSSRALRVDTYAYLILSACALGMLKKLWADLPFAVPATLAIVGTVGIIAALLMQLWKPREEEEAPEPALDVVRVPTKVGKRC